MFVFSAIGLLVLSVIGVSSWLFTFKTRERRYWRGSVYAEHYKSRVSHLQVGRSRKPGLLNVQFLEAFSVTSRRWVATSRSYNVATFQRHDVNFTLLWNVAT